MAKIYTKVGDKGQTSLVGGQKISKDDVRIESYGTVDELNCAIGLARVAISSETPKAVDGLSQLNADLELIQNWLFDLGSLLASEPADRDKFKLSPISLYHVMWMEGRIDGAAAVMKPLKTFILPGGTEPGARLHVARTVARRAERLVVTLGAAIPENAVPFLNRLSDYLFTMARYTNHLLGVEDELWKKTQPPV